MLRAYWYAWIEALARKYHYLPGGFHLLRWAIHKQLHKVQKLGKQVDAAGPIYIDNKGWIEIGSQAVLRSSWHRPISISAVTPQARIMIGERAFVNWDVTIGAVLEISIGDDAEIGDGCIIYDTDWHALDGQSSEPATAATIIGRGAWLGSRVIVLKGAVIGDNSVIAANSTVTSNIPANTLAAGSPARPIRPIERRKFVEAG